MDHFLGWMLGIFGLVVIALVWLGFWAVGNNHEFVDKCHDLGGTPIMTRDADVCLDPAVVLDHR